MSYGDLVVEEFVGFEVIIISKFCLIVGIVDEECLFYGV